MGFDMKIAILSDIHGNLSAFEAVIADMPSIDVIVCCGDIVGYYPDVNEVCALLRKMGVFSVRGNHDAYVVRELDPNPSLASALRVEWTREQLDSVNRNWLKSLPTEIHFNWDHLTLIVRHASPWDEETYLYENSTLLKKIEIQTDEILALGHTHFPMIKSIGNGILVNPGSVGQPRDGRSEASYAMLSTGNRIPEIRRVVYDVSALQKRLKLMGWDEATIEILKKERCRM